MARDSPWYNWNSVLISSYKSEYSDTVLEALLWSRIDDSGAVSLEVV